MASVRELRAPSDVDAFLDASHGEPVVLFKHSAACGLSAHARQALEPFGAETDPPLYLLVVQRAREASAYAAERLGVRHETPQVILVRDGVAVYDASHRAVSAAALREAVQHSRPAPA